MSLLASSLLFPLLCCKINLPPCLLYACHCSFLTRCNRLESLTWSCNATDHYEVSSKPRLTLYLSFVFCASKACCIRNFCKKRILSRFFLTGILIWTSVLTFHNCRGWSNVFVFCISLYTYFFLNLWLSFSFSLSLFSGIILYRSEWQYQEDIFEESKVASIFIRELGVYWGLSADYY